MISDRTQAIQKARQLLSLSPIYLDTETTGTDAFSEIVEICIIDDDGKVLLESLVKPAGRIPLDVIAIHGITDELVMGAPRWMTVWPAVRSTLAGRHVGIYNLDFDMRLIQQTNNKYKVNQQVSQAANYFCIMRLYAQFFGVRDPYRGNYRWQSLEAAGGQCGIPLPNSHRARDDALLARAVLHYMAESS